MSINNGYATLWDVKDSATPNATESTTDDTVLERIIEAVSRVIDAQCCRVFYKSVTAETRYYTANDPYSLAVDDLVSVTSLLTDDAGLRTYGYTWTTTDYDLWPYNASALGEPYQRIDIAPTGVYAFPVGIAKGVKLTGYFGWPSIPTEITQACIIASKSIYDSRFGMNENAIATLTAGGVVVTPRDFPAEAWTMINPYRRRR